MVIYCNVKLERLDVLEMLYSMFLWQLFNFVHLLFSSQGIAVGCHYFLIKINNLINFDYLRFYSVKHLYD